MTISNPPPAASADEAKVTVTVTQADREAAARRFDRQGASSRGHPSKHTAQMVRDGKFDGHEWVQEFARHRIAAAPPPAAVRPDGERESERLALVLINDDRGAAGLPPAPSRDGIPDSDGYVRNARAILADLSSRGESADRALADLDRDHLGRLHRLQHDPATIAKPRPGGAIVGWAADEIEAIRSQVRP